MFLFELPMEYVLNVSIFFVMIIKYVSACYTFELEYWNLDYLTKQCKYDYQLFWIFDFKTSNDIRKILIFIKCRSAAKILETENKYDWQVMQISNTILCILSVINNTKIQWWDL